MSTSRRQVSARKPRARAMSCLVGNSILTPLSWPARGATSAGGRGGGGSRKLAMSFFKAATSSRNCGDFLSLASRRQRVFRAAHLPSADGAQAQPTVCGRHSATCPVSWSRRRKPSSTRRSCNGRAAAAARHGVAACLARHLILGFRRRRLRVAWAGTGLRPALAAPLAWAPAPGSAPGRARSVPAPARRRRQRRRPASRSASNSPPFPALAQRPSLSPAPPSYEATPAVCRSARGGFEAR